MNPEHKKYILENMDKKSAGQITAKMGVKKKNVKNIIWMKIKAQSLNVPAKKTVMLASVVLIIILGLAVYANSLNGKFIYDDGALIERNMVIKDLSVLPKVFTEDIGKPAGVKYAYYRPLQMVTYAIDYFIWKSNPFGYHLTSVLLHILVALCIYWLIYALFEDMAIAVLTAVFFVVHPIHTTVVSYISTRAESLCLLLLLTSFIFYIKSLKTNSVIAYIIMISSYFLALLSKENALILPALLLLYHYTFKEKLRAREFLSISGIAVVYILVRITVLKFLIIGLQPNGTLLQRIPGFFVALTTYLNLMFLPSGLHIEYGRDLFTFADLRTISGILISIVILVLAFKARKNGRLVFLGLSLFIITLLPVSNVLFPMNAYMSENWLYLPSIGLFLIWAGFLGRLYKKERLRVFALILTACSLVFYSYLTVRQNQTWGEPIPFYERTLKYAPHNSRIYNNLGVEYQHVGREEDGIAMFKKAIEHDPKHINAYNNLGVAYFDLGRREDAVAAFKKALEIDPNQANARRNLESIEKGSKQAAGGG